MDHPLIRGGTGTRAADRLATFVAVSECVMLWWTVLIAAEGKAYNAVHGRVRAAVWYRFTATFSRQWRGYLAIVLLTCGMGL
jgi:hypothetical protein